MIETRLKYESNFASGKRKKCILWSLILDDIKKTDPEFPFSRDEISRKFNNLLLTYKRIKHRNNESGQEATRWEFFDNFDSVYGTKHFVTPPANIQASSLDTYNVNEVEQSTDEDENCTLSTPQHKRRRQNQNSEKTLSEVLQFMKTQEANEERRHQEQIEVDKERIDVLKDIRNLLVQQLQNKN